MESRQVVLLSFSESAGWRVRANSFSKFDSIRVVKFGDIKLLRLPVSSTVRNGIFCNPRKLIGV